MSFLSPTALSGAASSGLPALQAGLLGPAAATGGAAAPAASRDAAITDLSSISGSVNLLAQASGTQSGGDPSQALTLPPLPQMPAAQPAPQVPTDDHGTSNVVFSDPDAGGDLIH
jgi:hypothetical protein